MGLVYPPILVSDLTLPPFLPYAPHALGAPMARQAVATELARRGVPVPASRVMLTASTSEAYAYLFKLLCDLGDEILFPQPSYPLLAYIAQAENVSLVPYPLSWDGQWHIPLAELERRITEKTRAIIVVNPNNPTGSYLRAQEFESLLALNIPLVSDEVFAPYVLAPNVNHFISVLNAANRRTSGSLCFALGGLSKYLALPHLKCAWICMGGDPAAVDEAGARLECIADTFLSVSAPVQPLLNEWFQAASQIQGQIIEHLKENLAFLTMTCDEARCPLTLRSPEGGWSAVIQLPNLRTDEEWALSLLEARHVLVHPGYFYDFSDATCVVVSLLTKKDAFKRGIEELLKHVISVCAT